MYKGFQQLLEKLKENKIEEPLLEILRLYDIVSNRTIQRAEELIRDEIRLDFDEYIKKRKAGEPIEYIIGVSPFMDELFYCTKNTLIPRQETELLTSTALNILRNKYDSNDHVNVIDIGTGCGNIAVSLALKLKNVTVIATDLYESTIEIARKNVEKFKLGERVKLFNGDLFEPLKKIGYEKNIDLIVSNPPYIPSTSVEKLPDEIKKNEPIEAFDAGPFGIDIFKRLVNTAPLFLKKKGVLVFEIGYGQEKIVTRLLQKNGMYDNIIYYKDGDQIRVISAEYNDIRK